MSVTNKLKETKDKLKDKLKGQRDKMSASAHEHAEKAGGLFHKAKDAVRTEAQHETSESNRITEDMKEEAQHETSESKRIGKDIKEKVEGSHESEPSSPSSK